MSLRRLGPAVTLALLLLAGCGTNAPAAPPAATASSADAAAVALKLRQGFATGRAAKLYTDPTVTVLDGPGHLVRAEATEAAPDTMLIALGGYGLPGETGQPDD